MNIEQFDYSTDLGQVVLWQYDQSTNLTTLINDKQAWLNVNQTQFWQDWFANVFNLADPLTINEFGFKKKINPSSPLSGSGLLNNLSYSLTSQSC